MADLMTRLGHGRVGEPSDVPSEGANAEDTEAQFLLAARQLRDMAELEPERQRAAERHKNEATEESWGEFQRLRGFPNE